MRVRCVLDTQHYPPKISISNQQMESLHLQLHDFHGDWNYTITPRQP
ncbi:MAG: ISAzo13-like element transposase-related protein [Phycisphaerae bacterium]